MDRSTIETRDRKLIENIRGIVADKEKKRAESRPLRTLFFYIAPVLIGAGLLIAFLMSPGKPGQTVTPMADATTPAPSAVSAPDEPFETAAPEFLVTKTEPLPVVMEPTVPETPETETVVDAVPPVRIDDLVTCSRVVDREATDPATVFSLARTPRPTVWMRALADQPPLTLTHVYYHNDALYCRVPLRIDYARTRTWSRVTLDPALHLGDWRVDVVDETKEVLESITFRVVP